MVPAHMGWPRLKARRIFVLLLVVLTVNIGSFGRTSMQARAADAAQHGVLTDWQRFAASLLVTFGGSVAQEDTAAYAAHLAYATTARPQHERGTAIVRTATGYAFVPLTAKEGIGDPNFDFRAIHAGPIVAYWHSHGDVDDGEIATMAEHAAAVRTLGLDIYTSFTRGPHPENLWVEYQTPSGVRGDLIAGRYRRQPDDIVCTVCEPFETH